MGGKSKAPPAPNYTADARAQAVEDRKTWEQQLVGQTDMYGSSKWVQGADGKYTQQNTMSDALNNQHKNASNQFNKYQGQIANQGEFQGPAQVADYKNTAGKIEDFDPNTSGKAASDAMYASYMSRAGKEQGDAQAMAQTQLRQQGLQPGTEAYDRAYKNLLTSQGDVNAKANLDSIVLGGNEARQNYASQLAGQGQRWTQGVGDYQTKMQGQEQNYAQAMEKYRMPWEQAADSLNMWNSLRTGPGGFAPGGSYSGADIAGASQRQYESAVGKANQKNADSANKTNTVIGVATTAAMLY